MPSPLPCHPHAHEINIILLPLLMQAFVDTTWASVINLRALDAYLLFLSNTPEASLGIGDAANGEADPFLATLTRTEITTVAGIPPSTTEMIRRAMLEVGGLNVCRWVDLLEVGGWCAGLIL